MKDVTHILSAIEQGDPTAAEQLLPLVYDELRKLAAQRSNLTPGASVLPTRCFPRSCQAGLYGSPRT